MPVLNGIEAARQILKANRRINRSSLSLNLFHLCFPKLFRTARVVAAIIGVLDDADSKIRVNAAYALLDLKDPRVVEIRPRLLKIMEEDANISLITYYDNFGRPEYITVRNVVGGFIASMQFEFNKYNNTLIAKATVRKKRFGKILQVTDYDIYGRPKNTKWLCLDLKGNIITKDGKPVLVAPLKIGLKTSSKNYYLGFSHYITRTNTKVYPSKKCEEWTDVRNCRYVWQMPVLANQKLLLFPGVRYSL